MQLFHSHSDIRKEKTGLFIQWLHSHFIFISFSFPNFPKPPSGQLCGVRVKEAMILWMEVRDLYCRRVSCLKFSGQDALNDDQENLSESSCICAQAPRLIEAKQAVRSAHVALRMTFTPSCPKSFMVLKAFLGLSHLILTTTLSERPLLSLFYT